jgi:25S rRNA (uracil2634-N3)-methyltransferase
VPTQFDRIVFNFPHCGAGIKDQDVNVRTNQDLLVGFFGSATPLLAPGGEILVTLKTGPPYNLWNVAKCASAGSRNGLRLHTAMPFDASEFPGYAHRRTHGDGVSRPTSEELESGARTYIWRHA